MQIAQQIVQNVNHETALAYVTLDYEGRFLRRKRLVTNTGEPFLVELPETVSLSSTDGFLLDDDRVIAIKAKPEKLLKVQHSNLPRIAWHIGNRHTPCQVGCDHLLIQEDHVMEDLLNLLGADIEKLQAPFIPEGGAYGHGRTHSHSHNHSHQPTTAIDSADGNPNGLT
jgi:urease accessory protein